MIHSILKDSSHARPVLMVPLKKHALHHLCFTCIHAWTSSRSSGLASSLNSCPLMPRGNEYIPRSALAWGDVEMYVNSRQAGKWKRRFTNVHSEHSARITHFCRIS
jgi:hypothetical protein